MAGLPSPQVRPTRERPYAKTISTRGHHTICSKLHAKPVRGRSSSGEKQMFAIEDVAFHAEMHGTLLNRGRSGGRTEA